MISVSKYLPVILNRANIRLIPTKDPDLQSWSKPHRYVSLNVLLTALILILMPMTRAHAASCKLPKSYYKNVSCTSNSGYYLATKDYGTPVALLNSNGKKIADLLDYQRVDASKISEGLMPVQRNSRVGYVDMRGREVIPTRYDILNEKQGWARPVSNDRIIVKLNDQYGAITTSNQTVIPFAASINAIDNYKNAMAQVTKNKAVIWVDKNGKEKPITHPNGLATDGSEYSQQADIDTFNSSNASSITEKISSGFTTLRADQQDGKWGFINEQGIIMITYSFDEVRPFSQGLAGVRIDDKWGFIDFGGELVIPFRFKNDIINPNDTYKNSASFVFKDGKAWISTLENGDKMCIDKKAEFVNCE